MLQVSHVINEVLASRTYILSMEGVPHFWLVDCGDVQPLLERIVAIGGERFVVKGVLLTHVHYDHIYGLPLMTKLFPSLRVYTNKAGCEALSNERLNMSKYHCDPVCYEGPNVVVCGEGAEIELFEGVSAKVYEVPGHNPSCLCFEVGKYLFSGDAWIPGMKVVTTLPGADKQLASLSQDRIQALAQGKVVCPGHKV